MCASVLLIDDGVIKVELLEDLLRAYGHETIAALGADRMLLHPIDAEMFEDLSQWLPMETHV